MAVAGTLEIQMRADVARISQDMTQVKGVVGGAMSSVEKSVASAKSALGALGLTLGAGALAAGFVASIKSIAAMRSALDDLSDTTGDSITALDGLRRQGIVSGVALEQLGGALTKLSRNMNNADEEGQAAAQGIKAIGLNVETLRAMKPAEQMLEVAKALDQFADGGGKVAVATALMGKEGAKMLPYLKDLVNDGDAAGRVTAEQAAQAENLEKAMRRLQLAYSDTKDELATGLIPALAKWIESNREAIKIAGSASEAARLFVFNLDAMTSESPRQEIDRLTESLKRFQAAGSIGKFMQSPTGAIFGGRESDLQKQIDFLKFLERQQALEGRTGPQFLDARDLRAQQKPILDPGKLGGKAKEVAETESAYKSMKKTLDELLIPENERTEVGKVQATLDAMTAKKRAEFKPGEEADLKRRAALVDVMKREKDALEANVKLLELQGKLIDERADLVEADLVAQGAALVASRKSTEQIEFETTLIGKSNEARETAIALRALEKSGMDRNSSAYADQAKGLSDALANRQAAQAADEIRKSEAEGWKSMWGTVESTGRNVWQIMTAGGEGMAKSVGKAIKASIVDMLYQLAAKPIMLQIGASVAGSLGMTGLANAATTASGGGSALGSAGNIASVGNFASNLFSGGGILGTMGAAYSAAAGAVPAAGAMYAAAGSAAAGAGAAITAGLASIGPVGWAAIAAGAILGVSSMSKKGPKKQEVYWRPGESNSPMDTGHFSADNITSQNPAFYEKLNQLSAKLASEYTKDQLERLKGIGAEIAGGSSEEELWTKLEAEIGRAMSGIKTATQVAQEAAIETKELAVIAEATAELNGQRRSLEIQLMEAQGKSLDALKARREDELAALDASLRPLQEQIYAAQDLAGASTKAAEEQRMATEALTQMSAATLALANERRGLQIRLLEAQGRSEDVLRERRADEIAGTNDLNRELLRQIFAAEDLAKATSEATRATEAAAVSQKKLEQEHVASVASATDALRQAYQRESSDLEAMIGKWQAAGASLRAYSATLAGVTGAGSGYGAASSAFSATAASARLGDLTAIGNLQSVSETFRTASLAASATQTDYLRDIGRIQAAIADTVGVTDRQGTVAQQSLDSLRTQVSALIEIKEVLRTTQQEIAALKVATQAQESLWRRLSPDGQSLQTVAA